MKTHLGLIAAAVLTILPGVALAQTDEHHPEASSGATPAVPATPSVPMTGLPEQCMAMMPMMQQMMQMMQGGMMGGGTMGGMPMAGGSSEASKAYMDAMRKMDAPMMAALQTSDPDVAFVSAMIPHHQGAIDMAKAVLAHGKDEKVKAWANQIIKAQEAEIAEMQAWLKERAP